LEYYVYNIVNSNEKNINQLKYDTLFIVAESGFFLARHIEKLSWYKNVFIILADYEDETSSLDARVKELYVGLFADNMKGNSNIDFKKEYPNIKLFLLPPLSHNHHMSLFLKGGEENLTGKGFYYYQDGYSNEVNPISISEPENAKSLIYQFANYLDRSIGYEKSKYKSGGNKRNNDYKIVKDVIKIFTEKQISHAV